MYSFSSWGTLQQARWWSWQCSMNCFPVLARLSKTLLGSSLSRWEGEGRAFPLCLSACFPHGRWRLGIRVSSISELGVNNTRGKLSSAVKISTKLSLWSPNLLHLRSVFYFWWSLGRISLDCHLQLYVSEIIFIFCSCSFYKDQTNVRSAVVNSTVSQPPMWEVTNSMIPFSVAPLKVTLCFNWHELLRLDFVSRQWKWICLLPLIVYLLPASILSSIILFIAFMIN